MAARTEAYVDTPAFIAFLDRSDTDHELFAELFSRPPALLTSTLVIAEGHAWFLRRYDRSRALQFLSFLESLTPLRIVSTGPQDLAAVYKLLRRFRDQDLTLADAMGLHLLGHHRIKSCWSTDPHLALTGVPLAGWGR
jgi:predicted nucleic acid-binding protein